MFFESGLWAALFFMRSREELSGSQLRVQTRGARIMIKVSVFYPWSAGAEFDMKYYLASHMPLVKQRLGAACKGINVDQGVAGGAPGAPPSFIAIGHILADSPEAFQGAIGPH